MVNVIVYIYCMILVHRYLIVVTQAWVLCLICTPKVRGPQARGLRAGSGHIHGMACPSSAQGLRVNISGRARVTVLQPLCNTFMIRVHCIYNVACWFWLWVLDMLWFYLESTSLVKSSQKHHIQNSQSNLTSCTINIIF